LKKLIERFKQSNLIYQILKGLKIKRENKMNTLKTRLKDLELKEMKDHNIETTVWLMFNIKDIFVDLRLRNKYFKTNKEELKEAKEYYISLVKQLENENNETKVFISYLDFFKDLECDEGIELYNISKEKGIYNIETYIIGKYLDNRKRMLNFKDLF